MGREFPGIKKIENAGVRRVLQRAAAYDCGTRDHRQYEFRKTQMDMVCGSLSRGENYSTTMYEDAVKLLARIIGI